MKKTLRPNGYRRDIRRREYKDEESDWGQGQKQTRKVGTNRMREKEEDTKRDIKGQGPAGNSPGYKKREQQDAEG